MSVGLVNNIPGRFVLVWKADDGKLRENHADYFDLSANDHIVVPLHKLTPEKHPDSQPKSVDNAVRFMGMASRGEMGKRKPISVVAHGDGYKVVDGNATYGAAHRNGWSSLPVRVEGATSEQVTKAVSLMKALRLNPKYAERFSLAKAEPSLPGAYKPKALFTQQEMSLPKPSHTHAAGTVADLYKHAPETNAALESALSKFSSANGGKHVPAPNGTPDWEQARQAALAHPGVATHMGPMKKQVRVEQKIAEDRAKGENTSPADILDIARSTVTIHKHQDFHKVLPSFRQHMADHGFELVRVKDKYQNPQADGYRGILTNWKHKNGHVAEVQFNDSDLESAKPEGHAMLDKIREIHEGARQAGRLPNAEEVGRIDALQQQGKAHYEGAWNKQLAKHRGQIEKSYHLAVNKRVKRAGNVVQLDRRGQKMARKYYLHETHGGNNRPAYRNAEGLPQVLGADKKWHGTWDHMFYHNSQEIDQKRFEEMVKKQGGTSPA